MFRRILKARTVRKSLDLHDIKCHERQTKLFIEKGRENRQKLLEKLRGFTLNSPSEKAANLTDIKYSILPHLTSSTAKKRKLSMSDEGKSANLFQRLCYFKFVGSLKQSDIDPKKFKTCYKSDNTDTTCASKPSSTNSKDRITQKTKNIETQTLKREYQLAKLRGLDYPGYCNTKTNLGNYLHLTASFNPKFDICRAQKLPLTVFETEEYKTYLITGPPTSKLANVFAKAKQLTKITFQKLGLPTNLDHTKNDRFTTMAISNQKGDIVAVAEYVFMRDYIWIESLCVSQEFQNQGIGHMMFNMLYHIGSLVKKELLLFSLNSAVQFYKSCGFTTTEDFPFSCESGVYLSQKPF